MKKRIFLILLVLPLLFSGCSMFIEKDTTAHISKISYKPVLTIIGDKIISLPVGGTYEEKGVEAVAGDSTLSYEIVSGNVDPNTPGFYIVTYKATNQYGWSSYAYRAVLVYDGQAYNRDISGEYKFNNIIPNATVSKYPVDGYWQITNAWGAADVDFPLIFADTGDGLHFGIVPGEHPDKGRYSGTAVYNPSQWLLTFSIKLEALDDPNEFKWYRL